MAHQLLSCCSGTGALYAAFNAKPGPNVITVAADRAGWIAVLVREYQVSGGLISTLDPTGTMNNILTDISGTVQSATTTQTTLQTLSSAAAASLSSQSGVNLNTEAVNLVQFQQAFQASGKVMQTASTIFTTIFNLTSA